MTSGKILDGKIIIVTGAVGGIGSETARVLARAGARLILSDIVPDGQEVVERFRADGLNVHYVPADIGDEEAVAALVARTVEIHGRLDGAFNNAGVEQCATALADLTAEQWELAIRIDLTGVFYCLKHEIRAMLETGGGAIVNTASALGSVALSHACEYVAAKHGVVGLTKAAAADYGASGIRVNAVLPGIVNTPMVSRLADDANFMPLMQRLRDRHPIGRFGQPHEIGQAVAWLMSDAASFVTGAMIPVDGGYLAV